MKKYTQFEIAEFVTGYCINGQHWYSVKDIKGILGNALAMLEDEQDGIEATYDTRVDRDKFPDVSCWDAPRHMSEKTIEQVVEDGFNKGTAMAKRQIAESTAAGSAYDKVEAIKDPEERREAFMAADYGHYDWVLTLMDCQNGQKSCRYVANKIDSDIHKAQTQCSDE
jgi:hypothetical protein